MARLCVGSISIAGVTGCCHSRWQQRKTLAGTTRKPRLVARRLSHYSALYEVQNAAGLPLDAAHHLHHMVHGRSRQCWTCAVVVPCEVQDLLIAYTRSHVNLAGASNAFGPPLYFATFCALSVTLGALLYNLTNVLNEYFALQQQLSSKREVRT